MDVEEIMAVWQRGKMAVKGETFLNYGKKLYKTHLPL